MAVELPMATRVVVVRKMAAPIGATENGMRFSGCRVSGMRSPNQTRTTSTSDSIDMKIRRQLPSIRKKVPVAGAITGTMMKIMKTSDITRAMSRPSKRSRTMATASTRAAAPPRPWMARAMSNTSKLWAKIASKVPAV